MQYHVYDTSAVLYLKERFIDILKNYDKNITHVIFKTTLKEIETIISCNRDNPTIENRYQALLSQMYYYCYNCRVIDDNHLFSLGHNIEEKLCREYNIDEKNVTLYTNSLATFEQYAKLDYKMLITFVGMQEKKKDLYAGYHESNLATTEEIEIAYKAIEEEAQTHIFYENEYIIFNDIRDKNTEVLDVFKIKDGKYERVIRNQRFNSDYFGETKPKDVYQAIAMDSLMTNNVTLLGGPAGGGKTFLSIAYLLDMFQHGKIDRIIIFCNPAGARNAVKLGFYPGTVREKLLSTQAGNILTSKLGIDIVNKMMDEGTLQLVPVVDARGYEVPPNSGVYVMEAQNLTSDLLRLILQRCGEDNIKVIVDGDREEQLDMEIYEEDNGMQKMSQVFRGEKCFGQVDLKNIYRSEVARIAQLMR